MNSDSYKGRMKWIWFAARIVIVAIILAVIAANIDFGKMRAALTGAAWLPIFGAVLLFLLNRLITTVKWDFLLKRNGISAGLPKLLRIMFESSFLGMAIPSGLGVDIARLVQIRMEKHDLTSSASSVLADRILAVLTLALIAVCSAGFCWGRLATRGILATVIIVGLVALIAIILLMGSASIRVYSLLHDGAFRLLGTDPDSGSAGRIKNKVSMVHESLATLLGDPAAMATIIGMNIVVQLVRVAQVHLLFLAVGEPVSPMIELAFVPMILLIKLFPISPYMGIGVQEGAFVFFFTKVAVASEVAVSASLLMHLVVVIGILPGAALFFMGRNASSLKDASDT